MDESKLSGTEAFSAEPTVDMWEESEALNDHDLEDFIFDPETSDEFLTIQGLILVDEGHSMDSIKKRCQETNGCSSQAKRIRSAGFSIENKSSDESIISHSDVSVQSAQLPLMTPIELDHQLEQSMSRLALSMKRSEMSRQRVIQDNSSFSTNLIGLQSLLPTSRRRITDNFSLGLARPHAGEYMSKMGQHMM